MFNVSAFFSSLVALVKRYPVLAFLFVLVLVVFLSAPFLWVYRKAKAALPTAVSSALPTK